MNTDIRLSVGFWHHPKTKKTVKRLGLEGIRSLQILWLWAAMNRPDGVLTGMDWEDIELAADWHGEEKVFFECCLGLWIDEDERGYTLHDWSDHNPWQAKADERSESARKAANARWANANTKNESQEKSQKNSHSKIDNNPDVLNAHNEIYSETSQEKCAQNADAMRAHEMRNADAMRAQCGRNADAMRTHEMRTCPSPLLSSPKEEEEEKNTLTKRTYGKEREKHEQDVTQKECFDFSDQPGIEFQELRQFYDEHARCEAPLSGFMEYKQLRKSKIWPGISSICNAIEGHAMADPCGWKQFSPGLAKFLREHWWDKKPNTRASPVSQSGIMLRKNMETTAAVLAARQKRRNNSDQEISEPKRI